MYMQVSAGAWLFKDCFYKTPAPRRTDGALALPHSGPAYERFQFTTAQ